MAELSPYYVVSNPFAPDEELTVLFAGHSQTTPDHKVGPRVVDYYLLHHVVRGKGRFISEGITYELETGDSFLIEPGKLVTYTADFADPWGYRWVAFTGIRARALLDTPIVKTEEQRIAELFEHIELGLKLKKPGLNLKVAGYLHLLFAEYAEAAGHNEQNLHAPGEVKTLVQSAIHYLSTQFSEPITMEMMAESLGYNRAYLSKLFKEQTGITPVTFLLRLRLDKARRMLRERTELTSQQIAYSVGFRDPLYFSKQFHSHYGCSPTQYRMETKMM